MKEIELRTDGLLLREYRAEDLAEHHKLISDSKIMYYMQDVFSESFLQSLDNLAMCISQKYVPGERECVFLVIADPKSLAYMGGIGYNILENSPAGKRVEAGYFLKPEYWGQGIATRAMEEILHYGFEEDGVRRFDMTCIKDNIRSRRVIEKCGFVFEGERRGFEWHVDSVKSRLYFGLLKEEWEALQRKGETL